MNKLYNPIAIYNFNNKKYFIALDDEKIVYFKYENNEVYNDYSDEELQVFYEVYNSLKVDKKSAINIGYKKINNKVFEAFYDIKKELYFWYEIVGEKRRPVSKQDLELLNYKYNNQCLLFSEDDGENPEEPSDLYDWKNDAYFDYSGEKVIDENRPEIYDWEKDPSFEGNEIGKKPKTIKRAIIYGGKTIAIIIVAGISLSVLSDNILHTNISDRLRVMFGGTSISDDFNYENLEGQEYDYKYIENAITSNENLSDEEKNFFLKFKSYFDDNGKYMDLKTVTDRLANLKIVYSEDKCESPQVAGEYSTTDNVITIYLSTSFDDCDKSVLLHEFFHVTQKGFSKRLTMELSNELTTREYLRRIVEEGALDETTVMTEYDVPVYGTGYDQCMKIYYLMANLFDRETIAKYQCIPADTILTNALVDIDKEGSKGAMVAFDRYNMEQRAIELLDLIDELRGEPDHYGYRNVRYSENKYKKICDMLDYYYKIKFGKTVDECFVENAMSYDNTYGMISTATPHGMAVWNVMEKELESKVENLDPKYKVPMGEYRYVLPKTYFSDKHANPIIYFNTYEKLSDFSSNGFFVDIEITPEIESEYERQYEIAQEEISTEQAGGNSTENIDRAESGEPERDE